MAKYIFVFTILIVIAIENNNFNKNFYVESLPSARAETAIHPHSNQQYHEYLENHQTSRHHRHKRIHQQQQNQQQNITKETRKIVKRQSDLLQPSIENIENDELIAAHIKRHQEHQMEHLKQHEQHYHKQTLSNEEHDENLKSMPRPWQHLSKADEIMLGDEPYKNSVEKIEATVKEILKNHDLDITNDNQSFIDSISIEEESLEPAFNSLQSDSIESVELPPDDINTDTIEKHHHSHSRHSSTYRCPKCEIQRLVEHITEEELTQLRIEFVKNQILEKLRLKERPKVAAVSLPKPIQEGVTIDHGDGSTKNKELDDYYARTNKKFIFLERETRECNRTNILNSICFSFKIDDADADGLDVNTAVLWIFKRSLKRKPKVHTKTSSQSNNSKSSNNNNTLINQEDIVVYEVQPPDDQEFQSVSKTIAIKRVDKNVSDKWLEIHIEWPIKRWFGNHDLSHLIQISCESCDINGIEDMLSIDKDYRPFIMIDTQNRRRSSRQKRSINCTDGVTECCREKLYISFEDIGWGDWIIQPRGYDAYFCRGSCGTVASVTQSSSHHSTFLQKVIAMNRGKGQKPLELIPCCTAKQYSSLQLVFMDSNNTATQKTFPNMVIESCGCR